MPIGPFSTDYLEVNPGPAISGSTANLFAQEGERIRKKIEEDSAKAEAQAKGPVLAALYTDAYTKISQGDMSGFEKLSQAQLESSTNPFLASMAHDASVQAAKLASDYTDKSIAELRFKQTSAREDKLLNRQEKLSAFKENQDIRQRNAQKKSDYIRLKAIYPNTPEPVYEQEMALTNEGTFDLSGPLPTKSESIDTAVASQPVVNDKRITHPVKFGGYDIDINVPKMGRPDQTIAGVKIEGDDQDQKDADALVTRLKTFETTQPTLAKILGSLVANGRKFDIVPMGKAVDGQQKIELYVDGKPYSQTVTTKEGRKTIETDVPQQIPEEMFDLFRGKGKQEGIIQPFGRLAQKGLLKVNAPPGPSKTDIRGAEQDALERAKQDPNSIPVLQSALKAMGSDLVLIKPEAAKTAAASAPEATVNKQTEDEIKAAGVDTEKIRKQQEENTQKIKEDYAKAQVAQKEKDRTAVAEEEINQAPKQITDLKKQKDKLLTDIIGMAERNEPVAKINARKEEVKKLNEAIQKLEDRVRKARSELKDLRAIKE